MKKRTVLKESTIRNIVREAINEVYYSAGDLGVDWNDFDENPHEYDDDEMMDRFRREDPEGFREEFGDYEEPEYPKLDPSEYEGLPFESKLRRIVRENVRRVIG